MTVSAIEPEMLVEAWRENPPALYIDVRTVAEFAKGRPKGPAVNIPWLFYYPGTRAEHPNESFLLVIEALYPKETPLVLGCLDDSRAMPAAACLNAAGYQNLRLLRGGFTAWRAKQQMSSTDNRPGVSYVSLLTQVKRPPGKKGSAGH
jgi:rhodanese-related sulfurtransferase